jgi:hypothetical protein
LPLSVCNAGLSVAKMTCRQTVPSEMSVCSCSQKRKNKQALQIIIKHLQYMKGNKHECVSNEKDCNVHFDYKKETELGRWIQI